MTNPILVALVPVFFVMALGYGAGRLRIVDNCQVDGLNTLVMSFALPAAIFLATASATRSEMLAQGPLFAILGGVMLLLYGAWYFLVTASRADASLQALTIAFPNFAGVGLPIAAAVLGPGGDISVAVALATGSLLVSPLTLILVELNGSRGEVTAVAPTVRVLRALRRALTKPIVLAPALGILLCLADVRLGPVAQACLQLIGAAAAGTALFLTGLVLSAQSFRLNWTVVAATLTADLLRPLLTAAIVWIIPVPADVGKIAILLSAIPSGFFGILFAVNYRLDSTTAGSMVIASSLFSIVPMAFVIGMLFAN